MSNVSIRSKRRIIFMDELRGFAVFCMVFYHAFFTMAFLFNFKAGYELLYFFSPLEPFFAGLFIFISGISSQLSHSNMIRGLKLLGVALLITLVTYIFVPDEIIVFGILHFLSVCMILFALTKPALDKINLYVGIIICILLFVITWPLPTMGYIGLSNELSFHIPSSLYNLNFLFPLGITSSSFQSSDYFPLLPWIFVFLSGTFIGRFAKANKFPKFTYKSHVPFFAFLGRHALLIYVVHQPVIYGIMWLVSMAI